MTEPSRSPLAGRTVLLTRAAHQIPELARLVRARGARPVAFPCMEMECLNRSILDHRGALDDADWVLFTSANGVDCVISALGAASLAGHRIVAVGAKTASALTRAGLEPKRTARRASQEGVVELLAKEPPGTLVFYRAEQGRDYLVTELERRGWRVRLVPAYRMRCPEADASAIRAQLREGQIDAVLLGSSRTARHYARRIGDARLASRPILVAISPQVAEAARDAGLRVQVVARDASFDAMLDALEAHFQEDAR